MPARSSAGLTAPYPGLARFCRMRCRSSGHPFIERSPAGRSQCYCELRMYRVCRCGNFTLMFRESLPSRFRSQYVVHQSCVRCAHDIAQEVTPSSPSPIAQEAAHSACWKQPCRGAVTTAVRSNSPLLCWYILRTSEKPRPDAEISVLVTPSGRPWLAPRAKYPRDQRANQCTARWHPVRTFLRAAGRVPVLARGLRPGGGGSGTAGWGAGVSACRCQWSAERDWGLGIEATTIFISEEGCDGIAAGRTPLAELGEGKSLAWWPPSPFHRAARVACPGQFMLCMS